MRTAAFADQQAVALRVVARANRTFFDLDQTAIGVLPTSGADALGDDLRLGVAPMWIILVPVSACWQWWVKATEWNSPVESSPRRTQLGYFQVIAEPVSTWVQMIFERAPRHSPRLVTKL
jgi:hypothetical protein